MWTGRGGRLWGGVSEAPASVPVHQRKAAYLVLNGCQSSDHSAERSRWDIYTVNHGRREYHHTGVSLAVAVAFAVKHGLKIVDQENDLQRVWEVIDAGC